MSENPKPAEDFWDSKFVKDFSGAAIAPEDEAEFSIEEHGDGWALYYGRGDQYHGLNLCSLSDFDMNGAETRQKIVEGLNRLRQEKRKK